MPDALSQATNSKSKRSLDISPNQNLFSITALDIEYLCNNSYPFIQVVNSFGVLDDEGPINFISTANNWVIHDYGEAVSVSAPHGIKINFTVAEQLAVVSELTTLLIEKKGWQGIDLIAGSNMMQRLLWIETKKYNLELNSYFSSEADEKCYERLLSNAKVNSLVWEKKTAPKPRVDNRTGGAG